MNASPRIQMVEIAAIVTGGDACLMDCKGGVIRRRIPVNRLGPIDAEASNTLLWQETLRHTLNRHAAKWTRRERRDPWLRKAASLATSFRLRVKNRRARGGRKRFDRYATRTWHAASQRMVEQGYNRHRRQDRSGWTRWSHTVSGNHNKRYEQRYATDT